MTVFLALGSNLGDRLALLQEAIRHLNHSGHVRVEALSTIIETAPVGGPVQPWYLNCVAQARTRLAPQPLLQLLKAIERGMGRVHDEVHWGPRRIDLDILLYGEETVETPELTIPHPRLHERRFMLEPLVQLAPAATHPRLGKTVAELLDALPA